MLLWEKNCDKAIIVCIRHQQPSLHTASVMIHDLATE